MKKGDYTNLIQNKLSKLVEKYDLNYHVMSNNKTDLVDFKTIVITAIRNLLPKDDFLFLYAVENTEKKQYEVFVRINSIDCMFESAVDEEFLGLSFLERIDLLPRYSNFAMELYGVSNDTGFCNMEVCFISGRKASLHKAYREGLPILHPSKTIWYFGLDFKKNDKSKMFYLHINLVKVLSENELKLLFINSIKSNFSTKKIPTISITQLEVVDLPANQVKRRFPFLEPPHEFELWVSLFLNGCSIQSSLLVMKDGMYLRGRFADFFWAYGIAAKYNAKIHLIPYTENSDLPLEFNPSAFFSWINSKMKGSPS